MLVGFFEGKNNKNELQKIKRYDIMKQSKKVVNALRKANARERGEKDENSRR